jgi:hypothetical protein
VDGSVGSNNRPCQCLIARWFRTWVGNDLFEADKLTTSPLYTSTFHASQHSTWITQSWLDLRPHLRFVALSKFAQWTDNVGSMMKPPWALRTTTDYDLMKGAVDNSVESDDSIVSSADLLIVKLGMGGVPNRALPDVILGAVRRCIETHHKIVWVVDSPSMPLKKGHPAWSGELVTYLSQFTRVEPDAESDVSRLEDV